MFDDIVDLPGNEQQDMTLQIAMMGCDGAVVASDTKRSGHSVPDRKIFVGKEAIVAGAGHVVIGRFAKSFVEALDKLAEKLPIPKTESCMQATFEAVAKRVHDEWRGSPAFSSLAICRLLVIARDRIWSITFAGLEPWADLQESCEINGGMQNPAQYFRIFYDRSRSIDELKLLAALIVIEGAQFDPDHIRGLDVLLARTGEEPKFLDSGEIEELKIRCKEFRDSVGRELNRAAVARC